MASLPTSLNASNPLGFMAGLGLLAIAHDRGLDWRININTGLVPWVVLHGVYSADEVLSQIMADHSRWTNSPAFGCFGNEVHDEVKGDQKWVRQYLETSTLNAADLNLASALVAERITDNNGNAKPTDLHFTAGKMLWLKMARELHQGINHEIVKRALFGRWEYSSELPSFMWDVADDRVYALSSINPAKVKKKTEPGAEWLALRGLSFFPVNPGRSSLLTTATGGRWKSGWMRWPLWSVPATCSYTRSLLSTSALRDLHNRSSEFRAWGVHSVLQATITRSDQGGYGTFRPSQVIWQSET